MERLWSPWRSEYIEGAGKSEGCFFCDHLASDDDEKNGLLHRAGRTFVVLNAYPYNSGHLMVAPNRHIGELEDLTEDELHELSEVTRRGVEVLKKGLEPDGFNIGMNLGRIAGAGMPGHLHVHVVPRWSGDTNFMPVVGQTKVVPELIAETGAKLRPLFETA
ncbi:MAG: HIT domain-containing protein [Actinomycetota bacterium]|nr:HIT domain-containing protein [Actinomycetota bacterium]